MFTCAYTYLFTHHFLPSLPPSLPPTVTAKSVKYLGKLASKLADQVRREGGREGGRERWCLRAHTEWEGGKERGQESHASIAQILLLQRNKQETRDGWWFELREEVKGHALLLGCTHIVGYSEQATIHDDVCLLQVAGTAAVLRWGPSLPPSFPPSLVVGDEVRLCVWKGARNYVCEFSIISYPMCVLISLYSFPPPFPPSFVSQAWVSILLFPYRHSSLSYSPSLPPSHAGPLPLLLPKQSSPSSSSTSSSSLHSLC